MVSYLILGRIASKSDQLTNPLGQRPLLAEARPRIRHHHHVRLRLHDHQDRLRRHFQRWKRW